jgi:hypothetical protein
MVMQNNLRPDLPRAALEDCFRPPEQAVTVQCLHCGREYSSELIAWQAAENRSDGKAGWQCPYVDCDGGGYNLDILPAEDLAWDTDEADACQDCEDVDCEACDLFDDTELDEDMPANPDTDLDDVFDDDDEWLF